MQRSVDPLTEILKQYSKGNTSSRNTKTRSSQALQQEWYGSDRHAKAVQYFSAKYLEPSGGIAVQDMVLHQRIKSTRKIMWFSLL